ncbi:YcxB family protein [Streptomyces cavernicola]|uniref:YcxB family protein n=1 Tax=Streptomyces cavernicola TaxID=3043613 RepID=A0ABT6SGN8_9ACTN|nr:YcxB family protein [Streptomyces sp. B-S-A6]MDI3406568.1 YcxB family protein [Streptomyces sp. B-S-A6]
MAESLSGAGTADSDRPENADGPESTDVSTGPAPVELRYRPQPADTLAGLRVRERIKKAGFVGRILFLVVWVGQWLLGTLHRGSVEPVSTVLVALVALFLWGYPRIQAAHVQKLVGWQGEYRLTVSAEGLHCRTDDSALTQNWTFVGGWRETRGHFVLISRDPNIMCLDVIPKHGASSPEDVDRLRALLDLHARRV